MKTEFLYESYDSMVDTAYIITLSNNQLSKTLAQRCAMSCKNVGMNCEYYDAFDGTGNDLIIPNHSQNQSYIKWLKIYDHHQSLAEIACSLSHISLWAKCMELNKPIVILEHDAIMIKKFNKHKVFNAINYLGCQGQNNCPEYPPFSTINKNWYFINRAHAYSIDPRVARTLMTKVLDRGIFESADVMIRLDDVAIYQDDVYAMDHPAQTTIVERKKDFSLKVNFGD